MLMPGNLPGGPPHDRSYSRVFETTFLHKPDFDCSIQAVPPMVRATGAPRAVVTAINSL
jgi:hypothetical protein